MTNEPLSGPRITPRMLPRGPSIGSRANSFVDAALPGSAAAARTAMGSQRDAIMVFIRCEEFRKHYDERVRVSRLGLSRPTPPMKSANYLPAMWDQMV